MTDGIERGDAPELRRANPLWKWIAGTALVGLGGTAIAWMLISELMPEQEAEPVTESRPRLRMNTPTLDLPPPQRVSAPEPEPAVVVVAAEPAPIPEPVEIPPPYVPPLPEPEPREGWEPYFPPPEPIATREPTEPEQDPVEARRLSSSLGGGGAASTGADATTGEARRGSGGLDLSTTNAVGVKASRIADLTFTIPKGAYLPCVLNTAIQSDQSGMITCTLPDDVHGANGTVVLLDRGSQLFGEYRSASMEAGIKRAYVVWERVRTPTGVVVQIGSPGTGPLGRAGIGGHVDQHYWQRVGIPILMSAVSFGAESYARDALSPDTGQWVEQSTNDTISTVMEQFARIRPTLHTHQGAVIGIVVARDLDLSGVYRLARTGRG